MKYYVVFDADQYIAERDTFGKEITAINKTRLKRKPK